MLYNSQSSRRWSAGSILFTSERVQIAFASGFRSSCDCRLTGADRAPAAKVSYTWLLLQRTDVARNGESAFDSSWPQHCGGVGPHCAGRPARSPQSVNPASRAVEGDGVEAALDVGPT